MRAGSPVFAGGTNDGRRITGGGYSRQHLIINIIYAFFYFFNMGCKLSISVVHPSKSPKRKESKEFPDSPIMHVPKETPEKPPDTDDESYRTISIDSPAPDSELDIYQYV